MSTTLKRITFMVTDDVEEKLDYLKKEVFYNKTQSYMIRELVLKGTECFKEKETS